MTDKRGSLEGEAATEEVIASSPSVLERPRGLNTKGLQSYSTQARTAAFVAEVIGKKRAALDLTAGTGALLAGFDQRYGIEIDADQVRRARPRYDSARADVQQIYPLLRKLGAAWPAVVINPPFSLAFDVPGLGSGSSTKMVFEMARGLLMRGGDGCIICGRDRFEREIRELGGHRWYAIIEVKHLFPGVDLPCVIAFWREGELVGRGGEVVTAQLDNGDADQLTPALARACLKAGNVLFGFAQALEADALSNKLRAAEREYQRRLGERVPGQAHTIELVNDRLEVSPSAFTAISLAQHSSGLYKWLLSFHGQPPGYFALQGHEWRKLLALAPDCAITIAHEARAEIQRSVDALERVAVPLYPVKGAQRLGFLVDCSSIRCTKSDPDRRFVAGEVYPVSCTTDIISTRAEREKVTAHGPEIQDVVVERKAMRITIGGVAFAEGSSDLNYILEHFDVPDPGEIAARFPHEIAAWTRTLDAVENEIREREATFRFRWFQKDDLSRGLFKGAFVLGWEQGLGKALALGASVRALELAGRLPDGCALFVMPQDLVLQFSAEMRRFFGRELFQVANIADALELRERVRARRRYLRELGAFQRGERADKPEEVPGIWACTWFEALAITNRLDERSPEVVVKTFEEVVQKATKAEVTYDWESKKYVTIPGKPEVTETREITSKELCPRCEADRAGGGWNGTFCRAVPKPSWSTGSKYDPKIELSRVRACGYVHRELLRKPAYYILRDLFKFVGVDEGTKIKGDASLASEAVRGIRAKYRVLATGTPLKNFVVDLFWLLWWSLGDSSARFPYAYKGGKDKFTQDFAVIETRLDEFGDKDKRARPRILPEVSNLLRLWKMLCSSVVRRRMDEVAAVVQLDGSWKCIHCKAAHVADVNGPDGWTKPEVLECTACGRVQDSIVPLTYVPVETPWGKAQRKFFADWLDTDNFAEHFMRKHPDSPLCEKPHVVKLLAASIGQLAKLDYATTDPTGDPDEDYKTPELSPWTPGRLKVLQIATEAVANGERVLIGSCLVSPGPWIANQLRARGINAVHITEQDETGRARTKAPKKRAAAVAEFRAGRAQVLCTGVNAMALGHNLDVASTVIIDGLPWPFDTFDQFIKRARRLTSKKPVKVYIIMPSQSLGERKWAVLKDKTASSDLVLDGKLSDQVEQPIDRAKILREMQEQGARIDGTEVPEADVERAWRTWSPLFSGQHGGSLPLRRAAHGE